MRLSSSSWRYRSSPTSSSTSNVTASSPGSGGFGSWRLVPRSRARWDARWLDCSPSCRSVRQCSGICGASWISSEVTQLCVLHTSRAHKQQYVYRHFVYRVIGLIIWPFLIYLSFFWVHFKILKYSGPGDSFMSPAFQETLQGNELLLNSQGKPLCRQG